MVGCGERERETVRPEFDRSIMIDFQEAKVAYHGRRGQVHVASAFPLGLYYRAVFGWQGRRKKRLTE